MRISEAGLDLIRKFEGLRLEPYFDAVGIATIGYGHVLRPGEPHEAITEEEANELLSIDVQIAERCVNNSVRVNITDGQYSALVSFVFNLGCRALGGSTLLRKLNDGDDAGAADEFLQWVRAGGRKLPGLVARRHAERELFLT